MSDAGGRLNYRRNAKHRSHSSHSSAQISNGEELGCIFAVAAIGASTVGAAAYGYSQGGLVTGAVYGAAGFFGSSSILKMFMS